MGLYLCLKKILMKATVYLLYRIANMQIARSCPLLRNRVRCIYPLARVPSLTRLCHCPLSRCLRRARRACGTFGHRVHSGWKKRQGCAFSAAIRTAIKEMAVSWEAAFDCVGNALHRLVIAVASEIVGSSHGRFDLQMSSVLRYRNSRNKKLGKRSQFSPAFDLNMSHSQMLGKFEYGGGPIFKVVLEC